MRFRDTDNDGVGEAAMFDFYGGTTTGTGPRSGCVEISAHDADTIYLAATCYKLADYKPYLFKSIDGGRSWKSINGDLPTGEITRVVREDPVRRGLLYCGTESGVWVSLDDGGSWQRLRGNLPVTPIHDLIVVDGDLVVATHGRSFWILDDLSPLRQVASTTASADAHLFAPRTTVRWRAYKGHGMKSGPNREVAYRLAGSLGYAFREVEAPTGGKQEQLLDAGQNPPAGVIVHYWLRDAPAGDVVLAFLDGDGREIRSFTSRRDPGARNGSATAAADAINRKRAAPARPRPPGSASSGAQSAKPPRNPPGSTLKVRL